jgi:nitric oxide reductase NorE protein
MITLARSGTGRSGSASTTHLPGGEAGIWLVILGDMTVFALLFGVYLQVRSHSPALFDTAQHLLSPGLGAINTVLLVCSSLMVVTAVQALRTGERTAAAWATAVAFLFGLAFMAVKIAEWIQHASSLKMQEAKDFWLYYYILTGLHFFHVFIGMCLLTFMFASARKASLSTRRVSLVEGAGCFWHMVDLLWMVIFPLLYLLR